MLLQRWRDWRDRLDAMRDIRQRRAEAREHWKFEFEHAMVEAREAMARDDKRHAAAVWERAVEQYPGRAVLSPLALTILLGLRRFEEAENLMHEGARSRPGDVRYAIGLAEIAQAKGDHQEAADRWARVRKRSPQCMQAYMSGAAALRDLNLLPDAERLTQQAIARFPDEVKGYIGFAQIADQREDWVSSLDRWKHICERFDHLTGYVGTVRALMKFDRFDEAEEIMNRARVRYPTESAIKTTLATIAEARGDAPEAIARWKQVAVYFPRELITVSKAASALVELGDTSAAETVIQGTIERFPEEPGPLVQLGTLLINQGKSKAAKDVFRTLRDRFPANPIGYVRGAEVAAQTSDDTEAELLRIEYRNRFESSLHAN